MNMFSLEPQTLTEGPGPPHTPCQRLRSGGGTHICCPLLGPSSSPMHSPVYPDISPQRVCAIPGTSGPAPGLWAGRYSPLEEVTDYRETEPDSWALPAFPRSQRRPISLLVFSTSEGVTGEPCLAPGASTLERPWIPAGNIRVPPDVM